jgi:hypothetical protein
MNERANIDEMLSAFVDGEISDRQATEVKRLMLHDPAIAAKVERLTRQRRLLAALPAESAPADMASTVKAMLERKTLLDAASSGRHHILGSMHLFGRKFAAAAAMLALLGGLGYLVFVVVGSQSNRTKTDIVTIAPRPPLDRTASSEKKVITTSIELALSTESPAGLNSVVQKALASCGILDSATVNRQPSSVAYSFACDKDSMSRVLAEISSAWNKISAKNLTITSAGDEPVTVKGVTLAQVAALMSSPDLPSRMASARQFAEANTSEPAGAVADGGQELQIPKPSLTSPEFEKAATSSVDSRGDKVNMTIKVVTAE